MAKIVYNACYGGFSLSEAAKQRYAELRGITINDFYHRDLPRDDPILVQVVEELGAAANGMCANLVIEEIPGGGLYRITEYDGFESIERPDSMDWSVA